MQTKITNVATGIYFGKHWMLPLLYHKFQLINIIFTLSCSENTILGVIEAYLTFK